MPEVTTLVFFGSSEDWSINCQLPDFWGRREDAWKGFGKALLDPQGSGSNPCPSALWRCWLSRPELSGQIKRPGDKQRVWGNRQDLPAYGNLLVLVSFRLGKSLFRESGAASQTRQWVSELGQHRDDWLVITTPGHVYVRERVSCPFCTADIASPLLSQVTWITNRDGHVRWVEVEAAKSKMSQLSLSQFSQELEFKITVWHGTAATYQTAATHHYIHLVVRANTTSRDSGKHKHPSH